MKHLHPHILPVILQALPRAWQSSCTFARSPMQYRPHALCSGCASEASLLPRAKSVSYNLYLITHAGNGRRYVGKTKNSIRRRLGEHLRKPNARMRPDVRACNDPRTTFSIECLQTTPSFSYAETLEERYILQYNTRSHMGYNTLGRSGIRDAKYHLLKYRGIIA